MLDHSRLSTIRHHPSRQYAALTLPHHGRSRSGHRGVRPPHAARSAARCPRRYLPRRGRGSHIRSPIARRKTARNTHEHPRLPRRSYPRTRQGSARSPRPIRLPTRGNHGERRANPPTHPGVRRNRRPRRYLRHWRLHRRRRPNPIRSGHP